MRLAVDTGAHVYLTGAIVDGEQVPVQRARLRREAVHDSPVLAEVRVGSADSCDRGTSERRRTGRGVRLHHRDVVRLSLKDWIVVVGVVDSHGDVDAVSAGRATAVERDQPQTIFVPQLAVQSLAQLQLNVKEAVQLLGDAQSELVGVGLDVISLDAERRTVRVGGGRQQESAADGR